MTTFAASESKDNIPLTMGQRKELGCNTSPGYQRTVITGPGFLVTAESEYRVELDGKHLISSR
jgi:hypothetical protein